MKVKFKLPGSTQSACGLIVGDCEKDVLCIEIVSQIPDYNIGTIVLVDKDEIKSKNFHNK